MLQSTGSQRAGRDAATEQHQPKKVVICIHFHVSLTISPSVSLTTSSAVIFLEKDSTLVLVNKIMVDIGHDVDLEPMGTH